MMMTPAQHYMVNECKEHGYVILPDMREMSLLEYYSFMEFTKKGYLKPALSVPHGYVLTDQFYQDAE